MSAKRAKPTTKKKPASRKKTTKKKTTKKKTRKRPATKTPSRRKAPVSQVLTGDEDEPLQPQRGYRGRLLPGHIPLPGGGRPKGSREGQAALCRIMDEFFLDVSNSGDIGKALQSVRKKGHAGVLAIMKLCGFKYWERGLDMEIPVGKDVTIRIGTPRS